MTIRVVQWATGGVGKAAIEAVLSHPDLELVGAWVHSEGKHGKDVGELIGGGPVGVRATTSAEEILALDADCVVYSPLLPREDEVVALLRSGKNVVTPVGWVYPDPDGCGAIREACAEGGTTLHGTGIHPGGITERFPLMVSAISARVTHVRAEEFSDIRTYDAPDVVRHIMGFGVPPEQAMGGPIVDLLGAGFRMSVRMVADEMGFDIDPELDTVQEVAVATQPLDTPVGTIEPGQVAARKFHWRALVDGVPVVTASVNWFMGEEHFDPPWSFGPEGERFEVEITGDPDVKVTFKGLQPETVEEGLVRNPGIVVTANHCVSAIPYVVAAAPGIKTYLDLPLLAGRAAPQLGRGRGPGS
ncbi:NAD(P)H-dependent amine dehydrogenase family protein [Nocardioides silvaticus]|uniref:NAD(P)H-dependent amine dehydrogenase family protein n=1 Tax=Nocardioides silvaticus TaxID=2201891 RepID=UPI001B85ED5C|nr:dihydrodipicolinate reductase [Nocardioides silvaticus]